ncbi:hypothetical protein EV127DRAFT_474539 [Xylaria flabelliformis]|nr:hypothetical protein EV127DRAFT_474539 [Xylaria flabelliformis]
MAIYMKIEAIAVSCFKARYFCEKTDVCRDRLAARRALDPRVCQVRVAQHPVPLSLSFANSHAARIYDWKVKSAIVSIVVSICVTLPLAGNHLNGFFHKEERSQTSHRHPLSKTLILAKMTTPDTSGNATYCIITLDCILTHGALELGSGEMDMHHGERHVIRMELLYGVIPSPNSHIKPIWPTGTDIVVCPSSKTDTGELHGQDQCIVLEIPRLGGGLAKTDK